MNQALNALQGINTNVIITENVKVSKKRGKMA
nr:MAG TPA: hypothetical protein [Caudoviricetes sp.]